MTHVVLEGLTVIPGGGRPPLEGASVAIGRDGVVSDIAGRRDGDVSAGAGGAEPGPLVLMPPLVDLHFDVLAVRRRPRATVNLAIENVLPIMDAELATAGIGTVLVAARFEEEPRKALHVADAVALCAAVEAHAERLVCDWRIHARIEVTDDGVVEALTKVLAGTTRVALVSAMDHSAARTRFASEAEHVAFYAADWGVPANEVAELMAAKRARGESADSRRNAVADLARAHGLPLASHDDRTPGDVVVAHALGACVAEFPLTLDAAQQARELGMRIVLGAPNGVRDRSTSPGNVTVREAVQAGLCDILCSDYQPSMLLEAPFALADRGWLPLPEAVAMVTDAPARAIGLPAPAIAAGEPLDAVLVDRSGPVPEAVAMWRGGRLVFARGPYAAWAVGGAG